MPRAEQFEIDTPAAPRVVSWLGGALSTGALYVTGWLTLQLLLYRSINSATNAPLDPPWWVSPAAYAFAPAFVLPVVVMAFYF